jgi:hypothetical protein
MNSDFSVWPLFVTVARREGKLHIGRSAKTRMWTARIPSLDWETSARDRSAMLDAVRDVMKTNGLLS